MSMKRSSTTTAGITDDDDTGKNELKNKRNNTDSKLVGKRHLAGGRGGNERNVKIHHYGEQPLESQKVIKRHKSKSIKLINGDRTDDNELKNKSNHLLKEQKHQCQNIHQYENSNSITENVFKEKRCLYRHSQFPISFIQEAKHNAKMIRNTNSCDQYKCLDFPEVLSIIPSNYSPKNGNAALHPQGAQHLIIRTCFKNGESLKDSLKSWLHTQPENLSKSKLNYHFGPESSRTEKRYLQLEDLNSNQVNQNAYLSLNQLGTKQIFKLDLILADIIEERDRFLEMCKKNRFYRNPNYNQPWKIFYRISEMLINDVLYSIQSDFINGVSTFVNGFLEKETKY